MSGIHGQPLEVTVVGCNKLKDTEWISRQDPYVCLEYGTTHFRTRTCTDGGKNPTFQEKFVFTLIEGLRELNVIVWNSNMLTYDDHIGTGKIQLQKVLSQGYDDCTWTLQDKKGRSAGEVRLIMHCANANKPTTNHAPSAALAPPYTGAPAPQVPLYSSPPPLASFPPTNYTAPPPYSSYPSHSAGYPPPSYNHPPAAYPPTYPPTPSLYPTVYPQPPQDPHQYPPQDPHQYPPPGQYPPTPYPRPPY